MSSTATPEQEDNGDVNHNDDDEGDRGGVTGMLSLLLPTYRASTVISFLFCLY
jgi:hypothetical protein